MTKVVTRKLTQAKGKAGKPTTVVEKRVRDATGRRVMLRVVDLDSETFGEDLRYVFARNVAKARRENKRITGLTDFVPAKR